MDVPNVLQDQLHEAEAVLLTHPQHDLVPIRRRIIYNTIQSLNPRFAPYIRAKLAIAIVRYVLPIWDDVRAYDPLPKQLLAAAEGFLQGTVPLAEAQQLAGARNYAEDIESGLFDLEGEVPLGNAYAVLLAAAEALFETIGMSNFDRIIDIDENTTGADLDPWSTDTAGWGAIALAGGTLYHPYDPIRGHAFWSWWLNHAIPEVYRMV